MFNEQSRREDSEERGEKFDPTDPWDVFLAEDAKNFKFLTPNEIKKMTGEELFELAVSFESGREYDDGFGSWNAGEGSWVLDTPEKKADFDKKLIDGSYRVQLDYTAVGQPDGVGSSGYDWAVRLWDQKKSKEIPESRFFSGKLSYGITAALGKMPEWGRVEWKPTINEKEVIQKTKLEGIIKKSAELLDASLVEANNIGWGEYGEDFLSQTPLLKEIIDAGGAIKWVNNNLGKDVTLKKFEMISDKIYKLYIVLDEINKFNKDPEKYRKDYPDSPLFDEDDGGDGGEGWLLPPKWK